LRPVAWGRPRLVASFLIGGCGGGVGGRAAFRGPLTGHAISAAWFTASQLGWLSVHYTITAGLLFGLSLLAILAWQALTGERPREDQLAAVARSRVPSAPREVRLGAGVVLAITVVLVLAFR